MDHIRILNVLFDTVIGPHDIAAFRGAFAHRVGLEHEWFHNHDNSDNGHRFHYRYPLIQYKRRGNQPLLICIGQGVDAARMFFENLRWDMELNGSFRPMEIEELCLRRYPIGISEEIEYTYHITDWQPLNQKNFREYQQLEGPDGDYPVSRTQADRSYHRLRQRHRLGDRIPDRTGNH